MDNNIVYIVGDDLEPISISLDEIIHLEKVFGNKINYWQNKIDCQEICNKLQDKTGRRNIGGICKNDKQ